MREFIISEAIHKLGIPTTRSLAAIAIEDDVIRQKPHTGGVLVRTAESHLRIGTLQYFAVRNETEALSALIEKTMARHYPEIDSFEMLLPAFLKRQAALIAAWQGMGFIHGVMNTDNTHLGGLTIDYGPCGFIDNYATLRCFSSIDRYGRYAYGRQGEILLWNASHIATCLLPLYKGNENAAIDKIKADLMTFWPEYQAQWLDTFRRKLGLVKSKDQATKERDSHLINQWLKMMERADADFTHNFRQIAKGYRKGIEQSLLRQDDFEDWYAQWQQALKAQAGGREAAMAIMVKANPARIPRNHLMDKIATDADKADFSLAQKMWQAIAKPFTDDKAFTEIDAIPAADIRGTVTYCGT